MVIDFVVLVAGIVAIQLMLMLMLVLVLQCGESSLQIHQLLVVNQELLLLLLLLIGGGRLLVLIVIVNIARVDDIFGATFFRLAML